jgi:hypothetical protein
MVVKAGLFFLPRQFDLQGDDLVAVCGASKTLDPTATHGDIVTGLRPRRHTEFDITIHGWDSNLATQKSFVERNLGIQ